MYKTVLKNDGMMCGMCEAHINDVIRKIVPVAQKVKSSHAKGEAIFISEKIPEENMLIAAIGETGYTVEWMKSEPYEKKFLGLF